MNLQEIKLGSNNKKREAKVLLKRGSKIKNINKSARHPLNLKKYLRKRTKSISPSSIKEVLYKTIEDDETFNQIKDRLFQKVKKISKYLENNGNKWNDSEITNLWKEPEH